MTRSVVQIRIGEGEKESLSEWIRACCNRMADGLEATAVPHDETHSEASAPSARKAKGVVSG